MNKILRNNENNIKEIIIKNNKNNYQVSVVSELISDFNVDSVRNILENVETVNYDVIFKLKNNNVICSMSLNKDIERDELVRNIDILVASNNGVLNVIRACK